MLLVTVVPLTAASTVAVRLTPTLPAEKVKVACPLALVVPDGALICPEVAEKLTISPDNTALVADRTVAVTVIEEEPSLFTLFAVGESAIDAAGVVVTALFVPVVVETPLPPQPAIRVAAVNIKAAKVFV
jgi:hypothetical protein